MRNWGFSSKLVSLVVILVISSPIAFADKDKNKHKERPDKHKLAVDKVKGDLSIMVLGSGGPAAIAKGRASAGYLIFVDGQPRILMDVGGGTFKTLAESGANIRDLDTILLSHLHADHTGDLTAVIKTIYFHNNLARTQGLTNEGRKAAINIFGPKSTDGIAAKFPDTNIFQYPSTEDYAHNHYSVAAGGVERYLNAFAPAISGQASSFSYTATDLLSDWRKTTTEDIPNNIDGLRITAIAVKHGPVPAVGFRIDYKGKSIAYSGDTRSETDNMAVLAKDVDLLIYDTAITDTAPANPVFHALHTSPTRMGKIALAAKANKLVLSHITPTTETRLDEVRELIRLQGYAGEISTAKDLKVYNIGDDD